MIKFYIPLIYSLVTRYAGKSLKGNLQFVAIYLIPQLVILLCFADHHSLSLWILSIVLVIDLYEMGYIQNDAETIKKELKPTLRLTPEELNFYEKHKLGIYGSRLLLGVLLSYYFLSHCSFSDYIIGCIIILWLLLPLYYVYNKLRNVWNFLLLTTLTSYRYIIPLVLCCIKFDCHLFVSIIYAYIMYPLPTIVQQSVSGKFGIEFAIVKKFLIPDYSLRYLFRVKYYSAISICLFFIILYFHTDWFLLVLPIWYLIYGTVLYLDKIRKSKHFM